MFSSNMRVTLFFLAVFFLTGLGLFGGVAAGDSVTFVEEPIMDDQTWTAEQGPYRVTDDITVTNGATLTIEPGTTVEFVEDSSLIIRGELIAGQNNRENVQFTSLHGDAKAGSWDGLIIKGLAKLNNVSINKSTNGLVVNNDGVVEGSNIQFRATEDSAVILDSGGTAYLTDATFGDVGDGRAGSDVFFDGAGGLTIRSSVVPHGIDGHGDNAEINHLKAINNEFRGSVAFSGSTTYNDITFRNNQIHEELVFDNEYGSASGFVFEQNTITADGKVSVSAVRTLSNVTVAQNNLTGSQFHLSASEKTQNIQVRSNTGNNGVIKITGGNINDIDVRGNNLQNTPLELRGSDLSNIQVAENRLVGGNRGVQLIGEHIVEDSQLVQNRIYWADSAGIYIQTTTPDAGEVTGVNISSNMIARNGGAGIRINSPSANLLAHENVESEISGNHLLNNTAGLVLIKGTPTVVKRNHIVGNNNVGIRIAPTGRNVVSGIVFNVHQNNIYDNGGAMKYESGSDAEVNAENNYWGASSGPHYPAILPEGEGGNVSSQGETIDINPWAESRFDGLIPENTPPKEVEQSNAGQPDTEENLGQTQTKSGTQADSELYESNDDSLSTSGPGFGVKTLLIALLIVAVLVSRRL